MCVCVCVSGYSMCVCVSGYSMFVCVSVTLTLTLALSLSLSLSLSLCVLPCLNIEFAHEGIVNIEDARTACVWVCTCVWVCICEWKYPHLRVLIFSFMYVCMCMHACDIASPSKKKHIHRVCSCLCVRVCMCVGFTCMRVCSHMRVCTLRAV